MEWVNFLVTVLIIITMILTGLTKRVSATPLEDQAIIDLWPEGAPGSENCPAKYTVVERSKTAFFPDRAITGITKPSLTVFRPPHPNGTAMVVVPGGAYSRIVLDKEAGEMVDWLKPLGITVFILQYRLPAEGHANGADVPLADGQRAVRIIRQNAADWGLDPDKIGILGCSAGGHLAASLGVKCNKKVYEHLAQMDLLSARPDFLVLLYPVISMDERYANLEARMNLMGEDPTAARIQEYSLDLQITKETPTTFIALASDDKEVSPANSVLYYLGLQQAGVDAELHAFKRGSHGFGIDRIQGLPGAKWPELCRKWLSTIGMVDS